MIGIYAIVNNENNRVYIGRSNNIAKRWKQHISELKHNNHRNKQLNKDWFIYGEHSFSFHVIQECSPIDVDLIEAETIRKYRKNNLYNYSFSNHPWSKEFCIGKSSGAKTVVDSDGDILTVKKCPCCELDKLVSSFIDSLYCYECQTNIETELQEETQIFETTSFLTGISSAPEGKPIIKHSNN